jgi:hypothetical protein
MEEAIARADEPLPAVIEGVAYKGYCTVLVGKHSAGKSMVSMCWGVTAPTLTAYWKEVRARARLDHDFYVATKHYGVWYMKVVRGLPDAAIAAQAGWAEKSITEMVKTYAHAVDERRLDEIDAAFERDANRDAEAV